MQLSISMKLTSPSVAPVIAITVVSLGMSVVADFSTASLVMNSTGSVILKSLTLPELIQPIAPFSQYDGLSLDGVPPDCVDSTNPIFSSFQLRGMGPISDSTINPPDDL